MAPSSPNSTPYAAEFAPSNVQADQPLLPRMIGLAGLGFTTLGIAAIIANQYSPRIVGLSGGYLFAIFGIFALLYHALRDGDPEIRRVYGIASAVLVLAGLITLVVPGKPTEATTSTLAYHFLPWGAFALFVGLGFLAAFLKHENESNFSEWGEVVLLGTGGVLFISSAILGVFWPAALVGIGIVMALIGLAYLAVYLARVDVSVGRGYQVALGLGVLGALILVLALGRSIAPTVIHEGPSALKKINQDYDAGKVFGRIVLILLSLSLLLVARTKDLIAPVRIGLVTVGLLFAGTFIVGSFRTGWVPIQPVPYLVPSGLLLMMIGGAALMLAIAMTSDSHFVVLTRREFAAYLFSPIGYIVLFGAALMASYGYWQFLDGMIPDAERLAETLRRGGRMVIEEPIVQRYNAATLIAAFQALLLVPALTMRTFSEEKRTGTLEVLLTAPIKEWTIVVSKFAAAWGFFMLSWVPMGLYLIALWVVGGQPFDYRPLMSYYIAVGVFGATFIAIGIFFSSLTKNQIVAAVMTFAVMIGMLLTVWLRNSQTTLFGSGVRKVLEQFDFFTAWTTALSGSLALQTIVLQLTFAAFWLFITTKVLETRKWG